MYNQNVPEILRHAERYHRDRIAVRDQSGGNLTWGEFGDRVRRLATHLDAQGVGRGDRVAALLDNSPFYLELNFAIPALGAVLVLLNTRHSAQELGAITLDCEPSVLLTEPSYAELSSEIVAHGPKVFDVTATDLHEADPEPFTVEIDENMPAAIYYTGGTTGLPKGVTFSHRNLVSTAHRVQSRLQFTADDVYLHGMPMFHVGDSTWLYPVSIAGGAHAFIPKFDAGEVLEQIETNRVTFQCWLPTIMSTIISDERFEETDTSSLRLIAYGGASGALITEAFLAFPGCAFGHYYGATECCAHVSGLNNQQDISPDDPLFKSIGTPVPGTNVEVCRPDGTECDVREVGEIVVSGPQIMLGYWNKDDETVEVLEAETGRYRTGDLGYADESGYLFLSDRAKDMIKTGGENVFAAEVENVLREHPAVLEVVVFGVPDAKWGERVHAAIAFRPGQSADDEELIAFCKARIGGYKVPRTYEFHEELPKSVVGKINKKLLREAHLEGGEAIAFVPGMATETASP
jgi:long-chain acyl-CoA synthetase